MQLVQQIKLAEKGNVAIHGIGNSIYVYAARCTVRTAGQTRQAPVISIALFYFAGHHSAVYCIHINFCVL